MIKKDIIFVGRKLVLACDAQCHKAWGVNERPSVQLSDDENDYAFLADHELGFAPADPGSTEGGYPKPRSPDERLNKWCARECERSKMVRPDEELKLPNFDERVYNRPSSNPKNKQ
jgi:hypothetical protein